MKYLFQTPTIIVCLLIMLIFGTYVGYDISDDFINLYMSKLMLILIRYIIILNIVVVNYSVYSKFSLNTIVVRRKNLFNALINIIFKEILLISLMFVVFHIPIFILNVNNFISNIYLIFKLILNSILVSFLLNNIVRILDLKIKNRVVSCGIMVCLLGMMDFILENYNWLFVQETIFDFSYLFLLPLVYTNYIYIFIILLFVAFLLMSFSIYLGIKKDCFLTNLYAEKN